MNRNLGGLLRQSLAHADVKRHAAPTPSVNEKPNGDVSLGIGRWADAVFFTIAWNLNSINMPGRVLGANDVLSDFL